MHSNSLGPTPASFYPSFCHVDRLQVNSTPAIAMGTLQICSLRLLGVLWIPCLHPETPHSKAWILTFRFLIERVIPATSVGELACHGASFPRQARTWGDFWLQLVLWLALQGSFSDKAPMPCTWKVCGAQPFGYTYYKSEC